MTVALDLEVKFFAEEASKDEQEVGLAGLIDDCRGGAFESFIEFELAELVRRLSDADEIVGHNILNFDYAVLDANTDGGSSLASRFGDKTVDMLQHIQERHGRRVSLGELAKATLGRSKQEVELGVPGLWRTGRTFLVRERLRSDVELTYQVFRHGRDFGWVAAGPPDGPGFEQLEVDW